MKRKLMAALSMLLLCTAGLQAQEATAEVQAAVGDRPVVDSALIPAPVSGLKAFDTDNDHGHAITVQWLLSPDDGAGKKSVISYEVFRWVPNLSYQLDTVRHQLEQVTAEMASAEESTTEMEHRQDSLQARFDEMLGRIGGAYAGYPNAGSWRYLGKVPTGATAYSDVGGKDSEKDDFLPDYTDFRYRVEAVTADSALRASSAVVGPVQSSGQWFNTGRFAVFFAVLIFGSLTLFFVTKARRGADLYVRPLAGIEAVDDAIGRATEMGRPILYVLGLGTAADVATIASLTILGRVAKRVAEYQTHLIVPTYDPIVMSVAQEVVKSAYLDAGRPDAYKDDIVYFVTQSQFAYVAAVNGTMLRELPATNVYMGKFFAESLLLAETGAVAGSIQISGTDEVAQIPFFIVACDYTLIGEELYAASAYLSREPILLGSLKAQDYAKAAFVVLAIVGLVCANFGWTTFTDYFHVAD
jgi:hypothetical protein